jgi:hypothetical protein
LAVSATPAVAPAAIAAKIAVVTGSMTVLYIGALVR